MPLILQGATSGQATVQATDAQTVTLTLPATSGTLAVGGTTPSFSTLTVTGNTNLATSSGNVGIGTSSPAHKLDVNGGTSRVAQGTTGTAYTLITNTGGDLYIGVDRSTGGGLFAGTLAYASAIGNGASTALQFATSNTVRATIDSGGNVGIGTTTPDYKLVVDGEGSGGAFALKRTGTLTGSGSFRLVGSSGSEALGILINASEKMRITNGGGVLIGTSSGSGTGRLQVFSTAQALFANCTNDVSGDIGTVLGLGANCNNTSSYHLICSTGGPDKMYILGNGNLQNVNNSYGALSDAKLKENIVDATPKLDDLMKVKVRNYNLKSDPDQKQIGVVAQELEQVFPAMVEEAPDMDSERNILETTTKSVKYSVFVPMLIKAIQEQQAIITDLKARIETLENT